ncbi:hypothetical protein BURK1_01180 [Burkholderiales bacterium]|nr:hypothetical protein BURK1_01180 [Burkholderiales bacterium]
MTDREPVAPPRAPRSPNDPTGVDDGRGAVPIGARRPALRATTWIALVVVAITIAALGWRTMERKAIERAYADGVNALAEGRVDDARIAFDRVIALRPGWAAAYRQRGHATRDPARAIGDYSRAIELDGGDADAIAARGRAWRLAGQPAKSVEDLSVAIAIAERGGAGAAALTAWRADRGLARLETGAIASALDDLQHVAQARGTPEDHHRLALALSSAGDWHGARSAYDRAVASGEQPLWLGERALVLMRIGEDGAAGVDLVRCAELDSACADLHGTRAGRLARELGRAPPSGAR